MSDTKLSPPPNPEDPKTRLLLATIACIEEVGISAVTTRLIAAKANTNVAAVNYYYGSKEQLLDQTLEYSRKEGFINPLFDFDQLVASGQSRKSALRSVIRQMLRDSLEYPQVTFAHFRSAIENQESDSVMIRELNEFLKQLDERLVSLPSPELRQARRARLAQVWLAVSLNAMAPRLLTSFTQLDLTEAKDLDFYVDQLLVGVIAD
jgi:AcrR family transcriptional regulator